MRARPAGRPWRNPAKAEAAKINRIDKYIHRPHRIVIVDPVFQPIRKQRALTTLHTLDKTLHHQPSP